MHHYLWLQAQIQILIPEILYRNPWCTFKKTFALLCGKENGCLEFKLSHSIIISLMVCIFLHSTWKKVCFWIKIIELYAFHENYWLEARENSNPWKLTQWFPWTFSKGLVVKVISHFISPRFFLTIILHGHLRPWRWINMLPDIHGLSSVSCMVCYDTDKCLTEILRKFWFYYKPCVKHQYYFNDKQSDSLSEAY